MAPQFNSEFPLSDPAYDLIVLLHEKSKAIDAYTKYINDVQADTQLRQLLIQLRHDEHRHVELLKGHLARLLTQQKDAADELPASPPVPWRTAEPGSQPGASSS